MDLLDNYKKAWDNQPEEKSKFSAVEIYKLAHSKSSSIVKWIFIIGILEFVVLNSLYFFMDVEEAIIEYKRIGIEKIVFFTSFVYYFVLAYFIIKFYLNYQRISTIDTTKILMKKILKTRKTVKHYVLFNLIFTGMAMMITIIATINSKVDEISDGKMLITILIFIVVLVIFLGVLWLFYQLLYGFLLKKLNRNYKELSKLDDVN